MEGWSESGDTSGSNDCQLCFYSIDYLWVRCQQELQQEFPTATTASFFSTKASFPRKYNLGTSIVFNFNFPIRQANLMGIGNAGLISPSCTANRTLNHKLNKRILRQAKSKIPNYKLTGWTQKMYLNWLILIPAQVMWLQLPSSILTMRTEHLGQTFNSEPPPWRPESCEKETELALNGCLWARARSQVWLGCHSALQW